MRKMNKIGAESANVTIKFNTEDLREILGTIKETEVWSIRSQAYRIHKIIQLCQASGIGEEVWKQYLSWWAEKFDQEEALELAALWAGWKR